MLMLLLNVLVAAVAGVLILLGAAVVYGLIRNQQAAMKSDIVDSTNFVPRLASIWEVLIHPERAVTWEREASIPEETPDRKTWDEGGNPVFLKRVFPQLRQDLSEMTDIQPDDGEAS